MTTLTNLRIFEIMQVLIPLMEVEKRKMPLKGGYRLAKLKSQLTTDYQLIQDARRDKVKGYDWRPPVLTKLEDGTTKEEPGNPDDFYIPPEKFKDFNDWWKEFGAIEVKNDNITPMPLEQFFMGGDQSEGVLTPNEMAVLGDLLVWDETAGA